MNNPIITYVERCSDNKFDPQIVCDILMGVTRDQAISFLCWNDPNGCYTDAQLISEYTEKLTESGAKLLCMKQIWENQTITLM